MVRIIALSEETKFLQQSSLHNELGSGQTHFTIIMFPNKHMGEGLAQSTFCLMTSKKYFYFRSREAQENRNSQ